MITFQSNKHEKFQKCIPEGVEPAKISSFNNQFFNTIV